MRRLYFLLPSAQSVQSLILDLSHLGVAEENIHTLCEHPKELENLPGATSKQQRDIAHRLEKKLWTLNLFLFFIMLSAFLYAIYRDAYFWSLIPLALMIATFTLGVVATTVPDVSIDSFKEALSHGEILVMIDVEKKWVADIESFVHTTYPQAAVGGVSWSLPSLGI